MKSKTFYSHGKLLISGEYVVLDGALSLAVPTKQGQSLIVESIEEPKLCWKSYDENKSVWFENEFDLTEDKFLHHNQDDDISKRLIEILKTTKELNPEFLNKEHGYKIETRLEFSIDWGLGTSSTLINNFSQWANVDAFELLEKTFGGSGYDIACAQNGSPIIYNKEKNTPTFKTIDFNPSFKEHLYFVHLNKKQNSREGIKHYHKNKGNEHSAIKTINTITLEMTSCKTLEHFQNLMVQHETIISKITKQIPVKEQLFKNFHGAIKSLGAWGGDFIMVASKHNPDLYFKNKGYNTVIPYSSMVY